MIVVRNGNQSTWTIQKLTLVTLTGFVIIICLGSRHPFISPNHIPFFETCLNPFAPFKRLDIERADLIIVASFMVLLIINFYTLLSTILLYAWLRRKQMEVRNGLNFVSKV